MVFDPMDFFVVTIFGDAKIVTSCRATTDGSDFALDGREREHRNIACIYVECETRPQEFQEFA